MRPGPLVAACCAFLLEAAAVCAQISPGALSRAHAKLDGSSHCLDCHDSGSGVSAPKCLACHEALARRAGAGKGLHARPEYRDCKTCHIEHQGRDAELVWWGKQGRAAFDHSLTGHRLEGRHAALSCERCHRPPSFLGASASCASCHKDEHRGQFQGRACNDCHGQLAWKPAAGFDHARTRWPLTGGHAAVACARCHARRVADPAAPPATYVAFRAVAGTECANCHRDPHQGRLGVGCASCHNTVGWRAEVKRAGFDHSRTGYPLTGRHATVSCERCHQPGRPMRVAHASCTDCHRDPHAGRAAATAQAVRCERCHDVNGFRPSHFAPEDHSKTAFPLSGAHLAVACDACHKLPAGSQPGAAMPLRVAGRRCADCHRDPHRGELARLVAAGGCEACHRVESWREVRFDHAQTSYPLTGRHASATCNACHRRAPAAGAPAVLRFAKLPTACESCHRDPHAGQFARAGQGTDCARCHTTENVRPTRFDHGRDTAYALDGAHARLTCAACHRRAEAGGTVVVRYRPLPKTCSGCHRGEAAPGKEDRR